jgi:hypothetical protein
MRGKYRSLEGDIWRRFSDRNTGIYVAVRKCYVEVSTDSYGVF